MFLKAKNSAEEGKVQLMADLLAFLWAKTHHETPSEKLKHWDRAHIETGRGAGVNILGGDGVGEKNI